jgi:hypothetical protein
VAAPCARSIHCADCHHHSNRDWIVVATARDAIVHGTKKAVPDAERESASGTLYFGNCLFCLAHDDRCSVINRTHAHCTIAIVAFPDVAVKIARAARRAENQVIGIVEPCLVISVLIAVAE